MRILFVCTGNICRSPLAEGILRSKITQRHLHADVDSAGFEAFHLGDSPDSRAILTGKKYGIDISHHTARLFSKADFDKFDRIFVMDEEHYSNCIHLVRNDDDVKKIDFIMNVLLPGQNVPVVDPWYDGLEAFEKVYHQLDAACEKLVELIFQKRTDNSY